MLEERPPAELPARASAIAGASASVAAIKIASRMRQFGRRFDIATLVRKLVEESGYPRYMRAPRRTEAALGAIEAIFRWWGSGASGAPCLIVGPLVPNILVGGGCRMGQPLSLARCRGERCMSRLSLFNSPLLLGFDHFERALDRVSKVSADGYPPYNVEQLGENALRITLAVAGFRMDDLSITVEDSQLVVRGKQTDDAHRVYLHRGIAARQFQRSFVLAEGIEVKTLISITGCCTLIWSVPRPRAEYATL